ncbi:PP2C family protein-serine/threonine phosphatase [Streptomyces sp. DT171]|uniref:PP2C family protein-serine/threonine phosphatase n=1 Tax=Streptomyces sp. DT171 TaxID=3416524 RepID=UPI003CF841F8
MSWTLTVLALVAGVILNRFGPQPYMGLPLLAAAPLMAGATLTFRATLGVALFTCLSSVLLDVEQARPATAFYIDVALIGVIGLLALGTNQLIVRQRRELALARGVAEAVQRAVLPDPPRRIGPLTVAAGYTAAQAEALIGGDLYAVQDTPFGVRAIIGDVRGKGVQAVATVSVAIGAFCQEAENAPTLVELARRMDDALAREAIRSGRAGSTEDFTTAVLAEVSADGGSVTLVNRGHPPPYLVHGGRFERLDPEVPELPLGTGLGTAAVEAGPATVVPFPAGASLLFVTDGVTEARNERGVFYDPAASPRLARKFGDPDSLVDALTRDVERWMAGAHHDDMAILVVTRRRGGTRKDSS